ncbi:helix-turn-helix domain-containing protein [Natrarchaeobius halalkaliphilus]|nr:helix-turn-helix domain-containing protein [Natrarchaeobius halalkaliphilus]
MYGFDRTETLLDDPIAVLFVDDDQRWAGYLSQRLQRHEPELAVTVAISPNEALQQLQDGTEIDCVVVPDGTSRIDGLRLRERVRETEPNLPFLVVADRRSERLERVAATDPATTYLITGGDDDPLSLYVGKIASVVDRYRLRNLFGELETQHETLTEQIPGAVAIVQDDTFVVWNRALSDLSGYDDSQLNTMYPVTDLFHHADQSGVRSKLLDWYESPADQGHDARLVTEAEAVRHCHLTGRPVTHDDSPALLVTIRDRTTQRRRKRKLEWETELNRTIQQALVDSRTRAEMEEHICTQLCTYGYDLAWTGTVDDTEIVPQVVAGDDQINVSSRTFDIAGRDDAAPSVWAARLREPQFVNDLTGLLDADWQQRALRAGYRSGGAIPLLYEDVFYGVLAVYHTRLEQFDETERSLLRSLADLLAFAIHDVKTRQALSSNERVTLQLNVEGDAYYLTDIARRVGSRSGQFVVHGTTRHDAYRTRQYVTVDGVPIDRFGEVARSHPAVESVTEINSSGTTARFQLVVTQETPQSRLATLGALVNRTVVRIDGAELAIELPRSIDVAETVNHLAQRFDVSTESITDFRSLPPTNNQYSPADIDSFTDKQEAALSAAFHHGYFEQPRKNTAEEIATALGISHSTFLQHLRVAEQKLLEELYGK